MTLSPEVLSGLRERLEPCPFCGGAVELTSSKTLPNRDATGYYNITDAGRAALEKP